MSKPVMKRQLLLVNEYMILINQKYIVMSFNCQIDLFLIENGKNGGVTRF